MKLHVKHIDFIFLISMMVLTILTTHNVGMSLIITFLVTLLYTWSSEMKRKIIYGAIDKIALAKFNALMNSIGDKNGKDKEKD